MLWSIIPEEMVFKQDANLQACREYDYQGCKLLISPCGQGQAQIKAIISSDPAHYLAAHLQPGSIIEV